MNTLELCMHAGFILATFWVMSAIIWLVLIAIEALEEMDE